MVRIRNYRKGQSQFFGWRHVRSAPLKIRTGGKVLFWIDVSIDQYMKLGPLHGVRLQGVSTRIS